MITAPLKRWSLRRQTGDQSSLPASLLRTKMLVLQPTPFCNINCDYCYLPNRDDHSRMSARTLSCSLEKLVHDGLAGNNLTIVWHAGEPLTLPPDYYRNSFDTIKEILGSDCTVKHSIQTNGMLVNKNWCELFTDYNVSLGLSIDGPARFHDAHRKTRNGKSTHSSVMRAVELINEYGIDFTVIAVVTADTLGFPDEFLNHFREMGAKELGVNFDESEGAHCQSSIVGLEAEHKRFMNRIFQMTRAEPDLQWPRIRETDYAFKVLAHGLPSVKINSTDIPDTDLTIPLRIISVACNGDFSTFSPELLGQKSEDFNDFIIGNIHTDSYIDACSTDTFARLWQSILTGIEMCKSDCHYFNYCGGGAPVNKYYENGTFESTESLYCRTMIQHPFDAVLDQLEKDLSGQDNDD